MTNEDRAELIVQNWFVGRPSGVSVKYRGVLKAMIFNGLEQARMQGRLAGLEEARQMKLRKQFATALKQRISERLASEGGSYSSPTPAPRYDEVFIEGQTLLESL